jgi:hypothetical protein
MKSRLANSVLKNALLEHPLQKPLLIPRSVWEMVIQRSIRRIWESAPNSNRPQRRQKILLEGQLGTLKARFRYISFGDLL